MSSAEYFTPKFYGPPDPALREITDVYEHLTPPAGYPRFRVVHHLRGKAQTKAQYAAERWANERHFCGRHTRAGPAGAERVLAIIGDLIAPG